jgi:hypothetical protein
MDPGVLVADPRWRDYYQYHVLKHADRAQAQRALPVAQQDPYWWQRLELDAEASVFWRLTH